MAKTITINNGEGTIDLINGTYGVTANVAGYNNASINPNSITVVEGTNSYSFTIAATGTLTLHVTEDGTSAGVPVVGATFVRTDVNGTEYGSVITTDSNGDAVFDNVPYDASNAPLIYYKQTASDGNHEFSNVVQNTSLTTDTLTVQITNALGAQRTITLTDANYSGLPIGEATLELN